MKDFKTHLLEMQSCIFTLPPLPINSRELQEARQAVLSPKQKLGLQVISPAKLGCQPKTGRRLVGRSTARSLSIGCPGYGV